MYHALPEKVTCWKKIAKFNYQFMCKVSKLVLKRLQPKKYDFINTMFAGIPEDRRCVYTHVSFFQKNVELEDMEDIWVKPQELLDDQAGTSIF